MDIDINKHDRKMQRTEPQSQDIYLLDIYNCLFVKIYKFLTRITDSKFNKTVLERLFISKINKPVISLARIARQMSKRDHNHCVAVVVGTVTDDSRIFKVPRMMVCALHVTKEARSRILKAGGELITFDQLALQFPTGEHTVLIEGPRKACEAQERLGLATGVPRSCTKPLVRSKVELTICRSCSHGCKK